MSEEFYRNGKGEHSERGQHLVSCGKVAVVLSLEGKRELEMSTPQINLNNDMEETYQLLKALLDDDNRLLKVVSKIIFILYLQKKLNFLATGRFLCISI